MALVTDGFEQRGRSGYYYRASAPRSRPGSAYTLAPCEGCGVQCLVQVGAPAGKGRFCTHACSLAGERAGQWRGGDVGYRGAHDRVRRARGKAASCPWGCDATRYDWANLTGDLPDPDDYAAMCHRCHMRFDAAVAATVEGRPGWRPWLRGPQPERRI